MSAVIVTLFFGGPRPIAFGDTVLDIPGIPNGLEGSIWLLAKVLLFLYVYVWMRATLPRFRFDQLMALGWKVLLPLALAYILIIAIAVQVIERTLGWTSPRAEALALLALNLVLGWLLLFLLDRGRVVRGVGPRGSAVSRAVEG
jgi:NADH-quinone oxidoreductase subunit H